MRKLVFCAAAFLAPSLFASDTNSSQHESKQQLENSSSHENAVQNTSFDDVPLDLQTLVLQHVPLECPLVCWGWERIAKTFHELQLDVFLKKTKYFGIDFNSEKAKKEIGYVEQHFTTPGRMYQMLSKMIAYFYEEMIRSAEVEGNSVEQASREDFINQRIKDFLEENQMIDKLTMFLSRLEDPSKTLFNLLSGGDDFCEIPLKVRQYIAKRVWVFVPHVKNYYPLSSFLSTFHDKFDMFKDSLVEIPLENMKEACVEIALRINCTMPHVDDQRRLLSSINQLFSGNLAAQKVCLICEKLVPNSSISEIIKVMNEYPSIKDIATNVLESSSEHKTASWCMRVLGKPDASLDHSQALKYWLFSKSFLERHQLSNHQSELLKGCNAGTLLSNLPDNLTGLDIKALVEWVNADEKRKKSLSFSSLVLLYSLDKDDDALSKYSKSLSTLKDDEMEWLAFSQIALEIKYGRHLDHTKKVALLQLLYPEMWEKVDICSSGDRKRLLVSVVSLLDDKNYTEFVRDHLSESDFSLLVEASLESSKTCNVPPLGSRNSKSGVQALLKYIGDDVKKMAGLQSLSEYYRFMVFLSTDFDKVVDRMIESERSRLLDLCGYAPDFWSDWSAMRAAKRIYRIRNPPQHQ